MGSRNANADEDVTMKGERFLWRPALGLLISMYLIAYVVMIMHDVVISTMKACRSARLGLWRAEILRHHVLATIWAETPPPPARHTRARARERTHKHTSLVPLRYIDTVFLGRQNHDNQINAKFEKKILLIILNLVAYY